MPHKHHHHPLALCQISKSRALSILVKELGLMSFLKLLRGGWGFGDFT